MKFIFFLHARNTVAFGLFLLLLVTAGADGVKAQASDSSSDSMVLVKSWKVGDGKVTEQTLTLSLGRELHEYELDVFDTTRQRRFRLSLRPVFVKTIRRPSVHCWVAVFKEATKDAEPGGNIIGYDLLSPEGPGAGDYFPREGWAKYFCPVEKPVSVLDGSLYPINAERRFLIEKFAVIIGVIDYRYDEKENRLNKLNLKVEFKNQDQN
jgi:hypothetical protein